AIDGVEHAPYLSIHEGELGQVALERAPATSASVVGPVRVVEVREEERAPIADLLQAPYERRGELLARLPARAGQILVVHDVEPARDPALLVEPVEARRVHGPDSVGAEELGEAG